MINTETSFHRMKNLQNLSQILSDFEKSESLSQILTDVENYV